MKVCVTGGSGFIGKKLVSHLVQQGHKVISLSRNNNVQRIDGIELYEGDLTNKSLALDEFLAECEVVFHCAGEIKNIENMRSLHVDGTSNLLAAAKRRHESSGAKIHWVQLSSVGAYGPDQRQDKSTVRIVTEDTEPMPLGVYEVTKTDSDKLVIAAGNEGYISYTILRPSNVFGIDMPNQSIKAMIALIKKRLFFYIGANDVVATYIQVDDVVEALLACGFDPRAKGHILNISNDCAFEKFIEAIADAAKVARPMLRINEGLVRGVINFASKFVRLPLTPDRINAMRTKTTYPCAKIQALIGFTLKADVPTQIRSLM